MRSVGDGVKIDWNDKEVLKKIDAAVAQGEKIIADKVYQSAKGSTDFTDKTGKLRKSIKQAKSKFENGGRVVFANAPHSVLVELGHKIKGGVVGPTAFMRNALKKHKAQGKEIIMNQINKAIG